MPTTRFCIVRHGETDWNVDQRIQGQVDIPLNRAGLAQATAAARGLAGVHFSAVYSSDLARAWATAEALARVVAKPIHADPNLRERHMGVLQAMTRDEIRDRQPEHYEAYASRDEICDFDGGESLQEFAARIEARLAILAAEHLDETVLLVTHGGVLDIVYRMATGRPLAAKRDYPVPNAGLNWVLWRRGAWEIERWAAVDHLSGDGRDEL